MDFNKFACGIDDEEKRIDRILRRFLPQMSLGTIYKNIRSGFIRINGKKVSQNYRILKNDELWIAKVLLNENIEKLENTKIEKIGNAPNAQNTFNLLNEKNKSVQNLKTVVNFEIIFQNEHLLVVNKPYGVSSQGGENTKNGNEISVDEIIKENFKNNSNSLSFSPGPLHRLDKNTSGLLVFSKSTAGARWFCEKIKSHNLQKIYLGIVGGKLPQSQVWQNHILQNENAQKGFKTVKIAPQNQIENAKLAITHATPLAYGKIANTPLTLCQFIIETGRKHQIRVQSAFNGFALAGDSAYKSCIILPKNFNRQFFLHAHKLIFEKNDEMREKLNIPLELCAKLPKDFKDFLTSGCFEYLGD